MAGKCTRQTHLIKWWKEKGRKTTSEWRVPMLESQMLGEIPDHAKLLKRIYMWNPGTYIDLHVNTDHKGKACARCC